MFVRTVITVLTVVLLISACGGSAPATAPADFRLTYDWREGSLPPPYHYSYQIVIAADGAGTIALTPDYAGAGVPTWVESCNLSAEARQALYTALAEQDLFRERWRAEAEPPVGGSSATLAVVAGERMVELPAFVVPAQQERASAIHALVEAQVPEPIWAKLHMQREAYVAEQGG